MTKFLDSEDADIGTGGYTHAVAAASALVDAGELAAGLYWVSSTSACWVKRGASDVAASKVIASELYLPANMLWPIRVTASDLAANSSLGSRAYFAVIRDSADGVITFQRINRGR